MWTACLMPWSMCCRYLLCCLYYQILTDWHALACFFYLALGWNRAIYVAVVACFSLFSSLIIWSGCCSGDWIATYFCRSSWLYYSICSWFILGQLHYTVVACTMNQLCCKNVSPREVILLHLSMCAMRELLVLCLTTYGMAPEVKFSRPGPRWYDWWNDRASGIAYPMVLHCTLNRVAGVSTPPLSCTGVREVWYRHSMAVADRRGCWVPWSITMHVQALVGWGQCLLLLSKLITGGWQCYLRAAEESKRMICG